jgi:hypothetical protein
MAGSLAVIAIKYSQTWLLQAIGYGLFSNLIVVFKNGEDVIFFSEVQLFFF